MTPSWEEPSDSCANEGLRVLAERSPGAVPTALEASFDSPAWPIAHIAVELTVAALLLWRPRPGVALAALMHIPLTLIFAPGFAFTMMSGWVCFFTHDELVDLWRLLRDRWPLVLALGGIPAAASRALLALLFPGRWSSDPDWCIKEAIVWLVAAWLILAALSRPRTQPKRPRFPPLAAGVVVSAFIANGLTPYLGVQLHHTAAMLSNLRIDRGCHNSLIFPESLRGAHDPYVRVDHIGFAPHRATERSAAVVTERLWSVAALERARNDWCSIHEEPLPMHGTCRGTSFVSADICTDWPLPAPLMPDFRRYQVNLRRTCPQRCLH